jgi:sugar (pentulose or hexulose) kinase
MAGFLGIDVGTSFIKGAILDVDKLELRQVHRVPFPQFLEGLPPEHREVDPQAVEDAVGELLARLSPGMGRCEGVVLCGQMHGVVLVGQRGEAVSNYISWRDQRVTPAEFEEIAAQVGEAERRDIGNEFRPSIALSFLYWLKRHGALPGGEVTPVCIPDFVAGRLCGTRPAMEPTQAAALGALRLGSLCWHEGVIGKLGLESVRWPDVVPPGVAFGKWRGVPCYAAAGDQQCALTGAFVGPGELSVNISTGSQVALIADSKECDQYQTRPFFDGRFLRTITHIPGGRALNALIGLVTELGGARGEELWRQIAAAVDSVPATDLRAGVAFFSGACGNRGFLENLHEGNMTIGHLFRAVFESMARNYAACAGRLDPKRTAVRAVFSGGAARRLAILRDLTAAELGLPYRLSPHPEDTLIGLLVLARAFSGRSASVQAAAEVVAAAI